MSLSQILDKRYFCAYRHHPKWHFKAKSVKNTPLKFCWEYFWNIFSQNLDHFWPFSPIMTYFDQIDPINDTFDQSYVNKPDWNHFWDSFKKKIFSSHLKMLTYDVILATKWPNFYHFHQWPILTKLTPLMTLLTKFMYINLTEIIFKIF